MAKAQEVKDLAMSGLAQAIDDEKKEQWRVEGRSMLFDAKRVKNNFFSHFPEIQQRTWPPLMSSMSKSLHNLICSRVELDYQTVQV